MITTMAQVLILIAITIGLAGFAFMQYFTYRGLRRDAKMAAHKRKNPRLVDVHKPAQGRIIDRLSDQQEEAAPADDGSGRSRGNQALFYLHQEQMRRFMDAKLDILRATVETQNKIALLKAEVARLKAERDYRQAAESIGRDATGGSAGAQTRYPLVDAPADAAGAGNGADALSRLIERHEQTLDQLIESQRDLKEQAEAQLQSLEGALRELPGSSPEAWAQEQLHRQDG